MGEARLEPLRPEHLDATFDWLRDPRLRAAIDSRGEPDRDTHDAYWHTRLTSEREEAYAVVVDGTHVGNAGLLLDRTRRKAELWLYLGSPSARGAGVGRSAAAQLVDRAFGELGLNRVAVRVVSTNHGAVRFWTSLGFVEEGRLREDTGDADSIWLGLLKREWSGR